MIKIISMIFFLIQSAEKEWGSGITSLNLSSAVYALLQLGDKEIHVKNWRPQLLLCCKLGEEQTFEKGLFEFAKQLKKGKGLTVVTSIVVGDYLRCSKHLNRSRKALKEIVSSYGLDGLVNVSVASSVYNGLAYE
jgi:solute carrier family 12 (potassium/chloride transporter), member 4/6